MAQHREMRDAGVKPHVERVLDFFVVRCIAAEQFFGLHRLPCLNAILLHALRNLFEQFQRARMQRTGFFRNKERHRHAPLPLARQCPVRAIGDHAVQPRLAPRGEKFRVLDAAQCSRA